jgi:predicted PurR-regulated permease PerM
MGAREAASDHAVVEDRKRVEDKGRGEDKARAGDKGRAEDKARAADNGRAEEKARQEAITIARVKRAGASDDTQGLAQFDVWQRSTQFATIGLFTLAILGCLHLSHSVVVPVLLALVVGTILLPVVQFLENWRAPRALAVVAVALALIAVVFVLATVLSLPLTYWLSRATELGSLIREKLQSINQPLSMLKELGAVFSQATGAEQGGLKVDQSSTNIVGGIFSVLTPAVSQTVLFLFAMIFYLIYQKEIRTGAVFLVRDRSTRLRTLRILSDIEHNMTAYFGAFTLVNIGLGIVTALLAFVVGLPNPLLWGVLAAVLNYIPYLGPAIVVATLFFVGVFALPTLPEALIAPAAFVAITTLEGQVIAPTVIGHRLTLNPFSIFLSIAFWTWMWGPIGAFLATPILIAAMVVLRHIFMEEKPDLPE